MRPAPSAFENPNINLSLDTNFKGYSQIAFIASINLGRQAQKAEYLPAKRFLKFL